MSISKCDQRSVVCGERNIDVAATPGRWTVPIKESAPLAAACHVTRLFRAGLSSEYD